MTPERAQEIVTAINNRCLFTIDAVDAVNLGSLRGVSLAEMMEAKSIIEAENLAAVVVDGVRWIKQVPADRLIAAAYCMEHYPVSEDDAIILMPMSRSECFWHEARRKVLAIVPLKQSQNENEDEEAA